MAVSMQALMGLGLAACTGLRAFLPLFAVGLLARFGHVHLAASFHWLQGADALVIFGIATAIEIVADKIPAVDHALDALALLVKPVAATLLFASVMSGLRPLDACVLGLIAGGSTATVLHLKKAAMRLASSAMTVGMGNPLLSLGEDGLCAAGIALAITVPAAAVLAVAIALYAVVRLLQRLRKARGNWGQSPISTQGSPP